MKFRLSRYRLRPRGSLSAKSRAGDREGALLRVETGCGPGYADLHPWPELGDAPLEAQLESLRQGQPLGIARRALELAAIDARARSEGRNLLEGLPARPNHFLVPDFLSLPAERASELLGRGFSLLKFKMGRDLAAEAEAFRALAQKTPESLRFRLDFNAVPDREGILDFVARAGRETFARVDFLEDPIAWDARAWRELKEISGTRLALDRAVSHSVAPNPAIDLLVIKPAWQDPRALPVSTRGIPRVYTSSLDHPLGQVAAAWEAGAALARGEPVEAGGLLSHFAYEPDAFSEALRVEGPFLLPAEGTGFGFDRLLESLDWGSGSIETQARA